VTSIELNGLTLSYSLTCRYQSKGLLERFLPELYLRKGFVSTRNERQYKNKLRKISGNCPCQIVYFLHFYFLKNAIKTPSRIGSCDDVASLELALDIHSSIGQCVATVSSVCIRS